MLQRTSVHTLTLYAKELVQTEGRYNEIKDALKLLNKMDFDKLISSVTFPTTTQLMCLLTLIQCIVSRFRDVSD